jgi:uncharacterized membrane protein
LKSKAQGAGFVVALVVTVGAVIVIVLLAPAIKRQLNAWKLLPEPERLTELYFTNPNNLPTHYTPEKSQTVSFTVHNLEYRTTTYTYIITEQNLTGGQTETLNSGTFTLSQNQYKSPAVNIIPTDLGSSVKMTVDLIGENESIDYLVTKEGL